MFRLSIIVSVLLTASCAINTVTSAPKKSKFVHIDGTPAYVSIEPNKSVELINGDIYICLAEEALFHQSYFQGLLFSQLELGQCMPLQIQSQS